MSAKQFYLPFPVAFNSNGLPEAGAKLYFYFAGTTTPAPAYTSSALTTQHPSPVVASGSGRFANVYLNDAINYRLMIKSKAGATLEDLDPFIPGSLIGAVGTPGTNGATASNLTIGLFTGCAGQNLTAGGTLPPPDIVFTSGYNVIGSGGAVYVRDSAVDAAFVTAHPRWSFRDSQGNGYRLDKQQKVLFEMFGAKGDATSASAGTDNYAAWLAAKDFIHYFRVYPAGNSYYKPSVPVWFQSAGYEFSNYLDLTDAAYELYGASSTGAGVGGGTCFFFSGTCGIILQSWDTAGVSLTNQPNNAGTPHGASNSRIRDITPIARSGTIGAEQHGLIVKCVGVIIEGVQPLNFGGNGTHIYGNTPGAGNANCNHFLRCGGHNNGMNGIYVAAGDGNANVFIGTQANNNRKFGIAECSFLGNHWIGHHTAGNGMPASHGCGPFWAPANSVPGSRVRTGGHTYLARPGQDTLAATTTPGTNSAVWVDQGTVDPGNAEAWVSGHLYASGGAVYIGGSTFGANNNNRTVMTGYNEADQPIGWGDSNCSVSIAGNGAVGPSLFGGLGGVLANIVGSRQTRTDGTAINAMLGGDPNNGNQWLQLGFSDSPAWSGKMDGASNIYFDYNNGGASIPLLLAAGTALPGCSLPRGVNIGNLVNAANDAAAATAGVTVGTVYRNGSVLMVRVA